MDKVNETLDKANTFLDNLGAIGEVLLLYVLPTLIGLYVLLVFCGVFKKWELSVINAEAAFIKVAKLVCGFFVGSLKALQSKWLKWSMVGVLILYITAIILYFALR